MRQTVKLWERKKHIICVIPTKEILLIEEETRCAVALQFLVDALSLKEKSMTTTVGSFFQLTISL